MAVFELTRPEPITGDAIFGRNRTRRFQLRRWWVERPKRWAAWMMLNPSDAGSVHNDPTMLRVIKFTQSWGYDGCIVVNIYPLVTSDPRELWPWTKWQDNGPDWYARDDMQANLMHIEEAARCSHLRVAAFGAEVAKRDFNWVEECIERFEQPFDYPEWKPYEERCMCLGVTGDGYPIHPLARGKHRVPDTAQPQLWKGGANSVC